MVAGTFHSSSCLRMRSRDTFHKRSSSTRVRCGSWRNGWVCRPISEMRPERPQCRSSSKQRRKLQVTKKWPGYVPGLFCGKRVLLVATWRVGVRLAVLRANVAKRALLDESIRRRLDRNRIHAAQHAKDGDQ